VFYIYTQQRVERRYITFFKATHLLVSSIFSLHKLVLTPHSFIVSIGAK